MNSQRRISVVLFDGFELLDVFGPVELFSMEPERIAVEFIGPQAGPVRSAQGVEVVAPVGYAQAGAPDIVMVPGGGGTRPLAGDRTFLEWLGAWAGPADLVASVCTGSALLAAAGLLDGYRATSNKMAFRWAGEHGPSTRWVAQARWVHDRDRWTSSGVAAGMDMAAALMASLLGDDAAEQAATAIELEVHKDPDWDPFAAIHGLV
ncbi:MAG: DJ-1/PfpI family protein [Acidipropionibacterium sp.]|jgi:transcriptional regulator GlxA family with amidase domain|nr:DJ-1/PfpI family protein [Acidipropionibacterium sp.]